MATNDSGEQKKAPKKLIIVDGTDDDASVVEESKQPEKAVQKNAATSGDTPPVKAPKKINVASDDEPAEQTAEISSEETVPEAVEEPKISTEEENDEVASETEDLNKEITVGEAIAMSEQATEVPSEETELANEDNDASEEQEASEEDDNAEEEKVEKPKEAATAPVVKDVISNEETSDELFSDDKTARAVNDIVAKESDLLLEKEDAEQVLATKPKVESKGRFKRIFTNWWKNPVTKWGTFVAPLVVVLLLGVVPVTRYGILNAAGVRAGMSLVVVSNDTQQPLKNADVTINDKTEKTDEKGAVSFKELKLGSAKVTVQKRGYSSVEAQKTLGWGSNPLGNFALDVTGSQFTFVVTDFLSEKAVLGAEAVAGDYNAQADADGKIILPISQDEDGDITVTIKAKDYREEKITVKQNDTKENKVTLVPERKHVFVSKRTGKLDIYKIDADGTNESILLAATGTERDDLALLPHHTKDYVAVVSTRDGKRNKDGYLLSTLYVVNVKTGEQTKIVQSERIQLIDWTNDRVVFIAVAEGASAANAARSRLYSFEIGQPGPKELASANYFNDAMVFKGAVYYAPSSYAIAAANVKFYKVNADGSNVVSVLEKEVWNVFRSDYDTLLLSVQQDWYEIKSGNSATKLEQSPANPKTRVYNDSPDGKMSLWVDVRDGKGVLLGYDTEQKKDEVLQTQSGLSQPNHWLNNTTYVYRISDGREVADYVKSTQGGEPKKLRDVTNTDFSNYFNY